MKRASVPSPRMFEAIDKRTRELPEDEQFLVANCIQNLLNGSSWGIMTKEMVEAYGDPMRFNNELTKVYEVSPSLSKAIGDGRREPKKNPRYLVESNYQNALKTLQKVVPELVNNEFVQEFRNEVQDSIASFDKFYAKASKEGFQGYLGFYSINSTETMTFQKSREKAFQLPLSAVLGKMSDQNTRILVKGQAMTPSQVKANFEQVTPQLAVSDGATAIVVALAIRGTGK
ncbi:hypothetical protein [Bacillus toyonensis]|uniref:hypothetical protein n=1 Tax=Bacillus toyonensis TaxID=155322 RepID=UPI000BF5A078|nr:hypothetical protein [Bacillus toyonensis]PGF05146.1 hypothetical protein COM61_01610 [Bacillus toyonensis]